MNGLSLVLCQRALEADRRSLFKMTTAKLGLAPAMGRPEASEDKSTNTLSSRNSLRALREDGLNLLA